MLSVIDSKTMNRAFSFTSSPGSTRTHEHNRVHDKHHAIQQGGDASEGNSSRRETCADPYRDLLLPKGVLLGNLRKRIYIMKEGVHSFY